MKAIRWFAEPEVLALHDLMLAHYGGAGGLRDGALLAAALARPRQLCNYGSPTLAELAAAHAVGIVRNHPFVDGNKRTGFMLAAGFIELNGGEFVAPEAEAVVYTLGLAANEVSETAYARWLEGAHRTSPRRRR